MEGTRHEGGNGAADSGNPAGLTTQPTMAQEMGSTARKRRREDHGGSDSQPDERSAKIAVRPPSSMNVEIQKAMKAIQECER